jgi:hypothetical protein
VLLGVGDEFSEGLSLIALARCFCDAEKLDDFAIMDFSKTLESIFLDVEREAFAFLLSAADASKRNVLFHGRASRGNGLGAKDGSLFHSTNLVARSGSHLGQNSAEWASFHGAT